MLHNRLLKFDGLDRLGRSEEDWIKASLTADDARIDAQHDAFCARMQSAAIDNPDMERQQGHFELRDLLMTHFRHAWMQKEILWRVCAKGSAHNRGRQSADHNTYDSDAEEFQDDSEAEEGNEAEDSFV